MNAPARGDMPAPAALDDEDCGFGFDQDQDLCDFDQDQDNDCAVLIRIGSMVAILIRIGTGIICRNGLMIPRLRPAGMVCRTMVAYGAESPRRRSPVFVLDFVLEKL